MSMYTWVHWTYDRTGGACFWCGKWLAFSNYGARGARAAWVIDHFYPFARWGADQPYNWVPACHPCNDAKSDMLPWHFDPRIRPGERDPDNYL